MSIIDLLSNNASAIAALLGVIIGAGGTYIFQSLILKKQREWQLKDLRRDVVIGQYREMKEAIDAATAHLLQMIVTGFTSESIDQHNILYSNVNVKVDISHDSMLYDLYNDWSRVVFKVLSTLEETKKNPIIDDKGELVGIRGLSTELIIARHKFQYRLQILILEALHE